MTTFWVLWGFDAIVALVVFYFFFIGLTDGSVSNQNGLLWAGLIGLVLGVMLGSLWLKSIDYMTLAKILLLVLAIPGFLYTLFILFVVIAKPRWN